MSARRVSLAVAVVTAGASGLYVVVYLYRWEWHRAIVAGLIFVAVEVAVAAGLVLSRLRHLERRLDSAPAVLARVQEAAPPPARPFQWLDGDPSRLGVFVPILMGAGLLVSALAWLVERLARATAGATLERGLARRLTAVSLPDGGLVGAPVALAPPADPSRAVGRGALRLAALAVAGWLVAGGIGLLADLTQDRPDPASSGAMTTVQLALDERFGHVRTGEAAETLWSACRRTVRGGTTAEVSVTGPGTARLVLRPAVGPYGLRRLRGCLQDGSLDRLQGRVVAASTI